MKNVSHNSEMNTWETTILLRIQSGAYNASYL